MLLATLWIAALGQQGDSCQVKADCESNLQCINGECAPGGRPGSPCKRSADCPSPLRCRANVCSDPNAAAAPPPQPQYQQPPPQQQYPQQPQYQPPPPQQQYPQQPQYQPQPQSPGQPYQPYGPQGAPPPPGAAGYVRVQITTTNPAISAIFTLNYGDAGGPRAGGCQVPCTIEVPPGQYVGELSGEGVRKARQRLQITRDTTIEVKPGGSAGLAWGIVDLVFGPIFLSTGIAFCIIGANPYAGGFLPPGIVLLVGGVALTVLGPILIATSASKIKALNNFGFAYSPLREGGGMGMVGFRF